MHALARAPDSDAFNHVARNSLCTPSNKQHYPIRFCNGDALFSLRYAQLLKYCLDALSCLKGGALSGNVA